MPTSRSSGLSLLTLNGLACAHGVVVPMQCEYFALEGLSDLVNTIKQVQDGTFRGGTNAVFGLDRNGVGVGKVSAKVPAKAVQSLRAIEKKIITHQLGSIPTTVK